MTLFDFFTNFFSSFPFFFVWLGSVCLWGLLDIYNLGSSFFNSKHSYINSLNRENFFLSLYSINLNRKKLNIFFKAIYTKYM